MKIIDSHMHLGECRVFGLLITEEQLIKYLEEYNITAAIVQPFPGASNPIEVHDRIHALSQKTGKIFGMASINPYSDIVEKELERTLRDLKFVAIKLHTAGHAISPQNPRAKILFDYAAKYKVPIMIHTGPGPFSDPMLVIPRIEEYPDVKMILAHAGFGIYFASALWLAKKYDNVYVDTSWTYIYDLSSLVKDVPNKVLFGTDLIENVAVELAKLKALRLSDEIMELVLYRNAKEVFKLSI